MKQKLQDLALLIKQDKRYQVGVAAIVLMLAFYVMSPDNKRAPRQQVQNNRTNEITAKEAYEDLIKSMKQDVQVIGEQSKENTKQIAQLGKDMENDRARVSEIFKKMIDRLGEIQATTAQPGPIEAVPVGQDAPAIPPTEQIETFNAVKDVSVVPPLPPSQRKIAAIGPGDAVRMKLLAGVNAPTDGTPYPVVFKLVDDIRGPDGSALPLGEARIVAAAQGSLTDSRALMRLTQMNIRLPDGRKKVVDIDGWVVGEDGIRGMPGILIDPVGKVIAGAMGAGTIGGAGRAIASAQTSTFAGFFGTNQVVTGDMGRFAVGQGIGNGADAMTRIIEGRLPLYVPHVQVYSGRTASAVFSKTILIDDLFEALEDDDQSFANSVD